MISIDEAQHLLFYGETPDQKIVIDDTSRKLDFAIMSMFNLLEEHTVFDRAEVEEAFYKRLQMIANLKLDN